MPLKCKILTLLRRKKQAHCKCTVPKIRNKYIFPEMKMRGLVPNFYIHVSVSNLYIPTISPQTLYSKIGELIMGIYKSLSDTRMQTLGMRPHSFISGNICFEFSVQWDSVRIQGAQKVSYQRQALKGLNVMSKMEGGGKGWWHKVRRYREYQSVCPLVGIGTLPTPLSPASVPLPPETGGGGTLDCGWGVGGVPIPTTGEKA